jgi:hypothetical protein
MKMKRFSQALMAAIVLFLVSPSFAYSETIDLTPDQMSPVNFNPAIILQTANKLIALGNQDAYASLLLYAEKPIDPKSLEDRIDREFNVAWLCLLVYEPKPNSALRMPSFGGPDFPLIDNYKLYKGMESPDWPYFPLAVTRDVPFLLVRSYMVGGELMPVSNYLKDCQTNGVLRTKPYPIPNHAEAEAALNELVSSAPWKALDWHEPKDPNYLHANETREVKFLWLQLERVK